jgi:hypothetical protein
MERGERELQQVLVGKCRSSTAGSFALRKHLFAQDDKEDKCINNGGPWVIRTPDLLLRRQSLYPSELRAREISF